MTITYLPDRPSKDESQRANILADAIEAHTIGAMRIALRAGSIRPTQVVERLAEAHHRAQRMREWAGLSVPAAGGDAR